MSGERDEFRRAGADEVERMLSAARDRLAEARRSRDEGRGECVGDAFDGLVRARAGADGMVSELVLDPRVMRLPAIDLAEGVRAAVNQALRAALGDPESPVADLAGLDARIAEMQNQGLRQLAMIGESMDDFLRRAARR
ncbi:YbaB/EbfC family nucleoid-associated protein [Catenuloplanes japonicus]|uniref:YbaB/EbfC family nucleoid-associated protein n=1 Tax=Catenuloplanes japonicus TaxID=33876 RepID=UPI000527BE1D|nr:YbaB/EbfC family nucleoid-associated protein [Catenuloplanes japonicus]